MIKKNYATLTKELEDMRYGMGREFLERTKAIYSSIVYNRTVDLLRTLMNEIQGAQHLRKLPMFLSVEMVKDKGEWVAGRFFSKNKKPLLIGMYLLKFPKEDEKFILSSSAEQIWVYPLTQCRRFLAHELAHQKELKFNDNLTHDARWMDSREEMEKILNLKLKI